MSFGNSGLEGDGSNDEFAPMADINVTPFIDVMLVLLIIFMVTAPMLATGMKVELPKARTAQPLENQKPVIITIAMDGGLQVGDLIVNSENLVGRVRVALAGEDRVIQIRGDNNAKYGAVAVVLDLLAADGLTKIALVTDRKSAAVGDSAVTPR
jgi:biopolymer transport protein TolR